MRKTALFTYSSNHYPQRVTTTFCQHPFGMLIKERSFSSDIYRFGFNGKEKDDEVKSGDNTVAFEARIYDSRLGRFLSTDPLEFKYSWQTTYAYYKNSPVSVLDFKGMGGEDPVTESRKARRRSRKFRRKLNQMAAGTPNAVLSQANFDAVYNRYRQKRWFYLKQKVPRNTGDEKKVDNNGLREAYRIDEIYLRDNFAAVAAARGIVAPPPVLVSSDFQNIVVTANNPSITNITIPRNTCDRWQVTITALTPTPTPNPDNISVLGSTGGVQNNGDVVSTPIINKTLDQRTFSVNYTFDPANWAAGPRAAVTWTAPVLRVVTNTYIAQRLVTPQPRALPYYNRNFGFSRMILNK